MEYLTYFLSHVPLIMLVLAIFAGIIKHSLLPKYTLSQEIHYWLLFLAAGVSGVWGFVVHAFFPGDSAEFINWAASPFQTEVAAANLAMGVVGLLAYGRQKAYALAATIFTTIFLWGAAGVHIQQMIEHNNFAPGNAGTIFWTDLLIPLLLILTLMSWKEKAPE